MTTWKDHPDRIKTEHGTLVLYGFKPQLRRLVHDDRRDDPPAGSEPLYRFLPRPAAPAPAAPTVERPTRGPARRPDGSQRFPFPHLQAGDLVYGMVEGYQTIDVATACGGTVAATLTTRRTDLVRCEACLATMKESVPETDETSEPSAADYLAHHMAIRIRQGGVCRTDVDTSPDLDRVGADLLDDLSRPYRRTALAEWLITTGVLQPASDGGWKIAGLS